MKRRMIAVTLAFLLMITIMPASAAAADGNAQPIPVQLSELIYEDQSVPVIPVEITEQDPVVWENYRGKIYEFTWPRTGTLMLTLPPTKGTRGMEMIFSEYPNFFQSGWTLEPAGLMEWMEQQGRFDH